MNTKHTFILGSFLIFSVALFAQDKTTKKAPAKKPVAAQTAEPKLSPDQEAEKSKQTWYEYMTPGPMHEMLGACNGSWHEEIIFWMAPGAPETKTQAVCTNSMIFDGRYQESISEGDMMGMPFHGKSLVGYDNKRKVFQSTWVDNMGTGIMYMEGTYNEATKTLTMKGKTVDPGTGKMENVREVLKFTDDKNQTMEMYMTKDGKEFKNMEIKFTKTDG